VKHPEWRPNTAVSALGHLIEEAGEVLQQAGSLVRFGAQPDGSVTPGWACRDGLTNLQKLRVELEDLAVAVQRVREMVYGEAVLGGDLASTCDPPPATLDPAAWEAVTVTPGGAAGEWWCTCPGAPAPNVLNHGKCSFCCKTIVNVVNVVNLGRDD
jgi:hypothetical protein